MNKNLFFVFGIVMLLIFSLSNVLALGVTPGRNSIDYSPEFQGNYGFTIVNSEAENMNLKISVSGELADYISLNHADNFVMSASQNEEKIEYVLDLPEKGVLKPGLNKAEIVVLKVREDGGAAIGATLAVAMQVHVYVPYPGKYVESDFKIYGEAEKNFLLQLINRGEENVDNVEAEIHVYDSSGQNELLVLDTNSISLNLRERKEISAKISANDLAGGKYLAKALLKYDGEQYYVEKEFEIGEQELDLLQIYVEDFKLGEVAEFNVVVENKWGDLIGDVYAELRIFDEGLKEIANLQSAIYDIPGKERNTMILYWDTSEIGTKIYESNIVLNYLGKKVQQDIQLDVKEDSITVLGLGYVISSGGGKSSLVTLLGIIIGFLVLLNVFWFVVLRKRLKK
jgi:hypothetical protein